MSNFLLRRDDGIGLSVRPIRHAEIEPALQMILAGHAGTNEIEAAAELIRVAPGRGIDLAAMWVVADDRREKLAWAALPIPLAGRTTMVMLPPRLRPGVNQAHVAELMGGTLLQSKRSGSTMAQVMLEPDHRALNRALVNADFEEIAELVYLSRQVRNPIRGEILSEHYRLCRYEQSTHVRFGRCIERTYAESLDCPKLNGRRATEDIIDGHKAAGEFDPGLWLLLSDLADNDLGVLLLNRLHDRQGYELVYVGLTPEARGKKLADALIRTAIHTLAIEGGGLITTACDATNTPARKLYHRHGFGQTYSRRALVRTL